MDFDFYRRREPDPWAYTGNEHVQKIVAKTALFLQVDYLGANIARQHCAFDGWTIDVAAAMLLGFTTPTGVRFLEIAERYQEHQELHRGLRLAEMIKVAIAAGKLSEPLAPAALIAWLKGKPFPGKHPWTPPLALLELLSMKPLEEELRSQLEQTKIDLEMARAEAKAELETVRLACQIQISDIDSVYAAEIARLRRVEEEFNSDKHIQKYGNVNVMRWWLYGLSRVLLGLPEDYQSWPKGWGNDVWKRLGSVQVGSEDNRPFMNHVKLGAAYTPPASKGL